PIEALKAILDLTDQQLQQLTDLRQAHLERVRELRTQIPDLGQQMRELLQSPNPDPTQLGTLMLQGRNLRQQIQDATTAYRDSALGVLTETQKQKVAQIQEALRLAPQAGPLAAFGLIERPPFGGQRGGGRFGPFDGGPGMMGPETGAQPMGPMHDQGPVPLGMGPRRGR
ncbi:MAG: Spy/CpxP family protein refolding chaperone, partial [Acidobacteria bacterium]|nr:Spy/CpxP family protein refolding chaperone [Acidobacteriota bacterium]